MNENIELSIVFILIVNRSSSQLSSLLQVILLLRSLSFKVFRTLLFLLSSASCILFNKFLIFFSIKNYLIFLKNYKSLQKKIIKIKDFFIYICVQQGQFLAHLDFQLMFDSDLIDCNQDELKSLFPYCVVVYMIFFSMIYFSMSS